MGFRRPFDRNTTLARALQRYRPATGVEESQGNPYYNQPGVAEQMQIPADPGIDYRGFLNPFKMTMYQVAVPTAAPIQALGWNKRRTYLIIQNLGPGNLYVNFGSDAGIGTSLSLVQTQFYEQIGGGSFDYNTNHSVPNAFVSPQYISLLADAASTFAIITEGIWQYIQEEMAD